MKLYFLFTPKKEKYNCNYIYAMEDELLYGFFVEEDYIVKTDDLEISTIDELHNLHKKRIEHLKKNSPDTFLPILIEKEFNSINEGLKFLGSGKEDFDQGKPKYKKLPKVITPYDIDFDEDEEEHYERKLKVDDDDFVKDIEPDENLDDSLNDNFDLEDDLFDDDEENNL